jgi:capsid protein
VALIEFRRLVQSLQQQIIVHQFCNRIWERFIELSVLVGALPQEATVSPARWVPQGWDWVDPKSDVEAEILAIGAGLKSRRAAISEGGGDPDVVLQEIIEERRAATAAGITFTTNPVGTQNERTTNPVQN